MLFQMKTMEKLGCYIYIYKNIQTQEILSANAKRRISYHDDVVIWKCFPHYWRLVKLIIQERSVVRLSYWSSVKWVNHETAGEAWVPTQHCGYWCPGAKAPGHQYPQCWLNRCWIGLISCRNVLFIVKSSKKRNDHLKKKMIQLLKG